MLYTYFLFNLEKCILVLATFPLLGNLLIGNERTGRVFLHHCWVYSVLATTIIVCCHPVSIQLLKRLKCNWIDENHLSIYTTSWELKKPASPCSLLYSDGDQQRINSHQLPTLLPPRNPMESLHWRIKEQSWKIKERNSSKWGQLSAMPSKMGWPNSIWKVFTLHTNIYLVTLMHMAWMWLFICHAMSSGVLLKI